MQEIAREHVERMVELICFVQHCMRRARMESPLTDAHSARLGQGIVAAERIEEICRKTLSGRINNNGGNGGSSPATQ